MKAGGRSGRRLGGKLRGFAADGMVWNPLATSLKKRAGGRLSPPAYRRILLSSGAIVKPMHRADASDRGTAARRK